MTKLLLKVQDLKTNFYTYEGIVKALDEVNFQIGEQDTVGLVGETGCGKSVTSLSIMRLILPPGRIESGKVIFKVGKDKDKSFRDLLEEPEQFMQMIIRGNEISMIFQEPSSALNPVYTVGEQIAESFLLHQIRELREEALKQIKKELQREGLPLYRRIKLMGESKFYKNRMRKIALERAVELLRKMGIPEPESVIKRYPHELSGGMQQRIVIAIALACHPKLLIADEPTSNLDVTIQAQILDLIRWLKKTMKTSVLFISHDLGVISEMCNWVAIMYAGVICELAKTREIFKNPLHPYTKALLKAIPRPGTTFLESIEGSVPNLVNPPSGCRFHPRCPRAKEKCTRIKPKPEKVSKDHLITCHFFKE